jgi:ribokinase
MVAMPAPVIVVGSVNMDLVFTDVERIPAPGETVSGGAFQVLPGGKGANQVSAVARLGTRAVFVARIGTDDFGDRALDDLTASGVELGLVERVHESTGVAAVVIDREHENAIIIAPGANAELRPDSVALAPEDADAVVLACLEVPMDTVLAWAKLARERGWRFVLNPAPAQPLSDELLSLITVLTPNQHELEVMGRTKEELLAAGVEAVVVTLGGDGAELHRAGQPVVKQRPYPVEVLDTTGAGDAFNGALAAALAEGHDLERALARGAAAGALATRKVGARASQPTRREVDELIERTAG